MSDSKQLEKIFNKLLISQTYSFPAFLVGELNHLVWPLKVPVKQEFKLVRGTYVSKYLRPRISFRGTQDYLNRQLYRYFISDDIKGKTLLPLGGKEDYNPFHWKMKPSEDRVPVSLTTAPTAVDPELQDLVDELKRRIAAGHRDNLWAGVADVFTPLEMAQAQKILDDENEG